MARMPWFHRALGAGLMMVVGCQTAPSNTAIQSPPPQWPNPSQQSATRPSTPPFPMNAPSNNRSPQIGTPAGQGAPINSTTPRLRQPDPSAVSPPLANDWQTGQSISPPAPLSRPNEITPPAPLTSPQTRLPSSPAFMQPAPIVPAFPSQPPLTMNGFDNPTNPAGTVPTGNSLAPRNLTSPPAIYPTAPPIQ